MKKLLIPLGIIAILVAGGWKFSISPRYEVRLPEGWRWDVSTLAVLTYAGADGGYPEGTTVADDPLSIAERQVTISSEGAPAGLATITDHYTYRDAVTGAVQWELTNTAVVDPQTGKNGLPEYASDYYVFPRHTEQTTYSIRSNYLAGVPVAYERTEDVLGLKTYVFQFTGDLDDRLSWPDEVLEENQTILCFNFELTFWVEPVTGEIVKFREWCPLGDYVVDTTTSEPVRAIARWTAHTAGDAELLRAEAVRSQLNTYNLMTLYIPVLLGLAGVILLGVGIASNFMNSDATSKKVTTA